MLRMRIYSPQAVVTANISTHPPGMEVPCPWAVPCSPLHLLPPTHHSAALNFQGYSSMFYTGTAFPVGQEGEAESEGFALQALWCSVYP